MGLVLLPSPRVDENRQIGLVLRIYPLHVSLLLGSFQYGHMPTVTANLGQSPVGEQISPHHISLGAFYINTVIVCYHPKEIFGIVPASLPREERQSLVH